MQDGCHCLLLSHFSNVDTMKIKTHLMLWGWFKSEDGEGVCCSSAPAPCFCQPVCSESIRCESMPFISRRDVFFSNVVNQTTSKYWAQWSPHLPCSLSGDKVGVRLLWVCPLGGTWPVYFFLYGGWCGEWAQSKTWETKKGRTCGLMLWSERPFFACEFETVCFFLYVCVRTVIYFNVYVCLCVWLFLHWPLLSLVLLSFLFLVCLFVCF